MQTLQKLLQMPWANFRERCISSKIFIIDHPSTRSSIPFNSTFQIQDGFIHSFWQLLCNEVHVWYTNNLWQPANGATSWDIFPAVSTKRLPFDPCCWYLVGIIVVGCNVKATSYLTRSVVSGHWCQSHKGHIFWWQKKRLLLNELVCCLLKTLNLSLLLLFWLFSDEEIAEQETIGEEV